MKRLILTVGLPRSGKTTWARKQGYSIVSPDAIRLALHGQAFISSAEVWAVAKLMVRSLFEAGHEEVILDATNTTKARRDDWQSSRWERGVRVFEAGVEVCICRARAGDREDLIPVIERMADAYEPPDEFADGGGA